MLYRSSNQGTSTCLEDASGKGTEQIISIQLWKFHKLSCHESNFANQAEFSRQPAFQDAEQNGMLRMHDMELVRNYSVSQTRNALKLELTNFRLLCLLFFCGCLLFYST